MRKRAGSETPSIQSLGRGLSILEAVAESPEPVPLKHLTDLLGIDRSSVFRLASTLRRRQFLANPAGRKDYILGPSVWRLSRKYGRHMLVSFCREHVRRLTELTCETAHLGVREGIHALFIDHHAPTNRVVTVLGQTGELVPLHCSAHGKALIADFDATALVALYGDIPLEPRTRRTIVTVDQLAKACARIREHGYAIDDREDTDELRCVAAPIRDRDGVIIASIGISAPTTRFPKSRFAATAQQVSEVAREISASLSV